MKLKKTEFPKMNSISQIPSNLMIDALWPSSTKVEVIWEIT